MTISNAPPPAAPKTIPVTTDLLSATLGILIERPARDVYAALRALEAAPRSPDGAVGLLPESELQHVISALSLLPINRAFEVFIQWLSAASAAGCPVMVQSGGGAARALEFPEPKPQAESAELLSLVRSDPGSPAAPNGHPHPADSCRP